MEDYKLSKLRIVATVFYMLSILITSIIPMDREITGLQPFIDLSPSIQNLLHIPMFVILSILFFQILKDSRLEEWKKGTLIFVCCGSFGLLNEIIQIFVPGRYFGIADIVLNFIGTIVGILIYIYAERGRSGWICRIICE